MFQTTSTPVKVYRSTDPEAPQLEAVAGSLKTLLKACLITGYGTGSNRKESLGWAMPFEDVENAVFHSNDPRSHQHCMQVMNTQAKAAEIKGYTSMSDLNTGDGLFAYDGDANLFGYIPSSTRAMKWWLIGHSMAFVLIVSEGTRMSQMLYFGDVPSLMVNDLGNTLLANTSKGVNYYNPMTLTGNGESITLSAAGNYKGLLMAQTYTGASRAVIGQKSTAWEIYSRKPAYPNPISGSLTAAHIWLTENYNPRGLMSGVLSVLENMGDNLEQGKPQPLDGSSDEFLLFNFDSGANSTWKYNFLINVTQWEI